VAGGAIALGTAVVHQFTKQEVEQIEAKTGKPVEELTDKELAQATQELGITGEPLIDEDEEAVEAAEEEDE
jgi:hypothetical protein